VLKQLSIYAVLALTAATAAFATPLCSSNVTDNGTTYFNGSYSCQIGDLLFSNFKYTASGSIPVSKNQITVDSVGPAGTGATLLGPDIGLSFHAPWDAGTKNSTSDGTIDFTVSVLGGGKILGDFGLAQTSGVSGTGYAAVAEDGCGPSPCTATGGPLSVFTFQNSGMQTKQKDMPFPKTYSSVNVEKDITVSAGSWGTATISVVQDTFSQIPEPITMGLIGGGLALLGVPRLRRRMKG
jgi:hypothetical protein